MLGQEQSFYGLKIRVSAQLGCQLDSAPGHHFQFFESHAVLGITRGLSGVAYTESGPTIGLSENGWAMGKVGRSSSSRALAADKKDADVSGRHHCTHRNPFGMLIAKSQSGVPQSSGLLQLVRT